MELNAVIVAVGLVLTLSILKINVVVALTLSAVVAGWIADMPLKETMDVFQSGLGGGAPIALSYALLGAFAAGLSNSGITDVISRKVIQKLSVDDPDHRFEKTIKWSLFGIILLMAVASQNLIPIHIAFIPIVIPPLLHVLTRMKIDRRAVACVLTFGLVTTYMVLPIGFGEIFLKKIVIGNLIDNGLTEVNPGMIAKAMALPALGMIVGLVTALLFSYRKPREYNEAEVLAVEPEHKEVKLKDLLVAIAAIIAALSVQLKSDMIFGALAGFLILSLGGVLKKEGTPTVFERGVKMMAGIGFIMIAAAGLTAVIKETNHVKPLIESIGGLIGNSKPMASLLMLGAGLVITMGIGSSFSTVPIIASIYVPLGLECGFSPIAILAIVGTAGALGDAGSPASDSTLGPTAGLNVDGQHDHIRDTVIPTFLHYNIPLLIFGWIASLVL